MKSTSPQNPNPLKKKLASRFLKAMKKLSHKISSSPSPPSTAERRRRHRAVRAAAYASMASAVGPRRAWSRALLRKLLRSKTRAATATSGRKTARRNPRNIGTRFLGLDELCDVVPGGKAMDSCSLLSETGHYIKCLRAQVQIMREILDSSSSSSSSRIL